MVSGGDLRRVRYIVVRDSGIASRSALDTGSFGPMSAKRKLQDNLKRVEQRIGDACARAGRARSEVTLVTVTKYATLDLVRTLVEIGLHDLGENRVQELTRRAAMLREWQGRRSLGAEAAVGAPRWHMIGHLQRNKVRSVLPWVQMVHSVDSLRLAEEIDSEAGKIGRAVRVLLQVNISGVGTQHGVAVAAATHLVEQLQTLTHLDLRGLMAIAPLSDDETTIRRSFNRVRELFDEIRSQESAGPKFKELSLGMSQDFEWAIEVGATYVRIGSALFEGIEMTAEPAAVD